MSWLFSRALVEEFSAATFWDGAPSAPLSTTHTPQAYLPAAKTTEFSRLSQFGMTFAPLTDALGAGVLTWFLAGFRVSPTPRQLAEETLRTISGRRCDGSWQMSLPGTYLPRTSKDARSKWRRKNSLTWVTAQEPLPLERKTWVLTKFGRDIGYLHTPTTKANYCAPSMQKWPSARAFTAVFGRPYPEAQEWMMGWPTGWTDIGPLEMDKFQSWQRQHSLCSLGTARKAAA